MFCQECGIKQSPGSKFCSQCGRAQNSEENSASVDGSATAMPKITCWRCGNHDQLFDVPCSSCGVARPQSREASISVIPPKEKTKNDDETIEKWRNRESATSSLRSSQEPSRVAASRVSGSSSIPWVIGGIFWSLASGLLSQGQGLLDSGYCNLFGIVKGSNIVNVYSGKFLGCSSLLNEEMVRTIEDYSAIKFVFLMSRESFSATLYTVVLLGFIAGGLLIRRGFKNLGDQ